MEKKSKFGKGDWIAAGYAVAHVLALVLLWIPFLAVTKAHPYSMGFIKFGDLATFGSQLKVRIRDGRWNIQWKTLIPQVIIWGIWGMLITWAFPFFAQLADQFIALFPWLAPEGTIGFVTRAFIRSVFINGLFAWPMMVSHDIVEKFIFGIVTGSGFPQGYFQKDTFNRMWGLKGQVSKWIYYFWVWVHWLTYLLPVELRILFAAFLSNVLGILTTAGTKK